ncbi:hypothetical protein Cs7R123_31650 [Catellatospora sp. TT07R-123]|uniref:SCO2521 family protein n=1 Tax=Catellatospora sp. TT07R-123 TaxID=2733863 RepID=UPI001B11F3FC|nr:SCO2521 family protein [Catellatospora sp. TT07R-123]GHJ45823.1 hypothetical protein Cs7R123_31650 [Catellatospora sp. TT07R-123]
MTTANGDADVILGEVSTALLQHSSAVTARTAADLLAFTVGERVLRSARPNSYAVSPPQLTGIDCDLPAVSRRGLRPSPVVTHGVGTVLSRGVITGGQIVQGSSYTRLRPVDGGRRLPWSHYLAQPGVIELYGRNADADLAAGHLQPRTEPQLLNLSAISDGTIDRVQQSEHVDRRKPFESQRTHLRWVVSGAEEFQFTLVDEERHRTVRLPGIGADATAVAHLCEDIALHDWLLTTLLSLVGRVPAGSATRDRVVARLEPAVDYLLHLWMPAARVSAALARFWQDVERRPGLSRQWQTNVDRVRDQLSLALIAARVHRQ